MYWMYKRFTNTKYYKDESHEDMSSAKLALALCLQSRNNSWNSFFHLGRDD
jgi:hypothetical protein